MLEKPVDWGLKNVDFDLGPGCQANPRKPHYLYL